MTRQTCSYEGCAALADFQETANMQSACCKAHRPCACGYILLADGEEADSPNMMPGECEWHSRSLCTGRDEYGQEYRITSHD